MLTQHSIVVFSRVIWIIFLWHCHPSTSSGESRHSLTIRQPALSRVIEQRERQIKLESERLASVIANTDDALTMEFGLISVRHIVRSIHQGWSPQCEDRAPELSEWGVLKAGCVNGGTFRASEIKALPAEMVPRIEYLVQREGFAG